jgi:3-hydroxybutyryl-CoA dehydratase
MKVAKFDIGDLKVGMSVQYSTFIGRTEVNSFAKLSGDISPLHVNRSFGKASAFGDNLVHGILVVSHFSTIVGVLLPGRNALLNGIEVDFVKPIMVDSTVVVSASVLKIQRTHRMIVLRLLAFVDGDMSAQGTARVKVMPPIKTDFPKG